MRHVAPWGGRLVRVTLAGPELVGLTVTEPAASVRVLLPSEGNDDVVIPEWNGNEFLDAVGRRPGIRTLTPARVDEQAAELDVCVVAHGDGHAARWATSATLGSGAAVSGPGRGFTVDADAPAWLVAGDETALPAIVQLLTAIAPGRGVTVHVEAPASGRLVLPPREGAVVTWHEPTPGAPPGTALMEALTEAAFENSTHVWAAGEAAAMQRLRRHLYDERGLPRRQVAVRGYWKLGRSADASDDAERG